MPDTLDPVQLDEDTGPLAAQGNLPVDVVPQQSPPKESPSSAPTMPWGVVKSYPEYQSLPEDAKRSIFKHWVSTVSPYMMSSGAPREALNQFKDKVTEEGKGLGLGFLFNNDLTPTTIGQHASRMGQTAPSDEIKDFPFTVPYTPPSNSVTSEVGRNVMSFVRGLTDIGTEAVPEAISAASHFAIDRFGFEPGEGLAPLDAGIAARDEMDKERIASQGTTFVEGLAGGLGHVAATFPAAVSHAAVGGIAGIQAANETYHSEVDRGVEPWKAALSASVAGVSTGALFTALGYGAGQITKTVLGDKFPLYLAGNYKPTVAEAGKMFALDALGLAGANAGATVIQNAADQRIYDPERKLMEGVPQSALFGSVFALARAPELLASFRNYATDLRAAQTNVQNAANQLKLAQKSGNPETIASAQSSLDSAQSSHKILIDKAFKETPPPTIDEIQQANAILEPKPVIAPADPLDAIIDQTNKEASNPEELPVVGQAKAQETLPEPIVETPPEPSAPAIPEETAKGVGPMTEQTVKQIDETPKENPVVEPGTADGSTAKESVEQKPATESGSEATPESTAPVAETDQPRTQGRGTAPAVHLGDQEQAGGKPPIPLYNLTEDIPGHPKGSTVSGDTLVKEGYDLPDKPKEALLRNRIVEALGKAIPKSAKIVFSTEFDHPAWIHPDHPGKIFANPEVLGKVLQNSDIGFKGPHQGNEYLRKLFAQKTGEEVIHTAQLSLRGQTDHGAIYEGASLQERTKTIKDYGNDSIDPEKATSPEDAARRKILFAEEHARQILQRKALGETTEDIWKQGDKKALVRYFQALYEKIRAHIASFGESPELKKYLKNIDDILGDAEKQGIDTTPSRFAGSQVAFASTPKFYSTLEKAIDEKMPNKASSDQIRAMLKGNGVKDDEIKWSGVDDYLKENPTATKDELQRFLKEEGGVKIRMRHLGDKVRPTEEEYKRFTELLDKSGPHGINLSASEKEEFENLDKIIDPYVGISKFDQYQLPGGTNYREQVFTLPDINHMSFEKWKEQPSVPPLDDDSLRHHYNAEMNRASEKGDYTSSHFPEVPNYLAHMRLNDRTDAEGNPGTFIEEMQSDRHQQGRNSGYKGDYSGELKAEKTGETAPSGLPLFRVTDDKGKVIKSPVGDYPAKNATEAIRIAKSEMGTTPDAPFRKTWHEFLFRRALGDAVASGKKWIGWTTGTIQAERYDLSKQIKSVTAEKMGDKYDITAIDNNGRQVLGGQPKTAEELPDVVGKELAQKIVDHPDQKHTFSGLDLKVGGEGMKGFYDNIVPKYVAKYVSKWGVKPEISNLDDKDFLSDEMVKKRVELMANEDGLTEPFANWDNATKIDYLVEAKHQLKDEINDAKIWKLPINDAMRKSIEETGQPVFASKPPEFDRLGRKPNESFPKAAIALLKSTFVDLKNHTPLLRATGEFLADRQLRIQKSNEIREHLATQLPDPKIRSAVARWIEANGDQAILKQWENGSKYKVLKSIYEKAQNLSPSEIASAQKIKSLLDSTLNLAKTWGVNINRLDNYFPHYVIKDPLRRAGGTGQGLRIGTDRQKLRTFDSMYEGEKNGIRYNDDAADGMAQYFLDINHAIDSRKFVSKLWKVKSDDGRQSLATPVSSLVDLSKVDNGGVYLVGQGRPKENSEDYRSVQIPALKGWAYSGEINGQTVLRRDDLLVHPKVATFLENMFRTENKKPFFETESTSRGVAVTKSVAKFFLHDTNSSLKANLFLLGGPFHYAQEGQEALGHRINPFRVKNLDYSDPEVRDAIIHGFQSKGRESLIDSESASDSDKTILALGKYLTEKLGAQRASEAIAYAQERNQALQKHLFEKYIPSIKFSTYQAALQRNLSRMAPEIKSGKYTISDVKYMTADQVNNAYGELNYTFLNRDPRFQAILRFFLLAPDFFEARAKHLGQAITGIALRSGREQFSAMAIIGLGLGIISQASNMLINGEMDLSHPFELRIGNRYYGWRSSPGDAFNLIKDLYSFGTGQKGKGLPYLSNRASPLSRFVMELYTGRNWRGEAVGSGDAITDAIANNMPLLMQPFLAQTPVIGGFFTSSKNNPVSPFEQVLGGLGIKVSRYSPIQVIKGQAHEWVKVHGPEVGLKSDSTIYPVSPYRPLQFALEDANYDQAYSEYQKLLQAPTMNPRKISNGMQLSLHHAYTGSAKGDRAFYNSLDAHDKALFDAAKARQGLLLERFREMLQQNQSKK